MPTVKTRDDQKKKVSEEDLTVSNNLRLSNPELGADISLLEPETESKKAKRSH